MILVSEIDKVRITRYGANKLFGIDRDARKAMEDEKLIKLFNRIWSNGRNVE